MLLETFEEQGYLLSVFDLMMMDYADLKPIF